MSTRGKKGCSLRSFSSKKRSEMACPRRCKAARVEEVDGKLDGATTMLGEDRRGFADVRGRCMHDQLGDDQVCSTNLEIGVEMAMVEKLLCAQSKWRGERGMEPVVCLREEWSGV